MRYAAAVRPFLFAMALALIVALPAPRAAAAPRRPDDLGGARFDSAHLVRSRRAPRHHHQHDDLLCAARRAGEAHARQRRAPSLAKSWTVSPDGLVYEFALRRGVVFHNGETHDRGGRQVLLRPLPRRSSQAPQGEGRRRSRSSIRCGSASGSRSLGRTSWPSMPRPRPALAGSCPRPTWKRSATRDSRRPRSAPGPTSSSRSTPASSWCWRLTNVTGARRPTSSGWSCA